MKTLNSTELYKLGIDNIAIDTTDGKTSNLKIAWAKVLQGVGIIEPQHLETQLFNLKKSTMMKTSPLLQTAINAYENLGVVKLFNTAGLNSNSNNMPITMPYVPSKNCVYMNMNKICEWSSSLDKINNLAELSDLKAVLEFGYVIYQLTTNPRLNDQLFNNSIFIERLTSAYVYMFYNVICKCLGASQTSAIDSTTTNLKYTIAKFFLIYCLEKQNGDAVNAIAYSVVKNSSSTFNATQMFEENCNIDYSSLSNFLKTMAYSFFSNNLSIHEFGRTWMAQFGDATLAAAEYPMYLLYFLYATYYQARLGTNNVRLVTRHGKEQIGRDINKIMQIIYSTVR